QPRAESSCLLLSVIVPTFNEAGALGTTLDGLRHLSGNHEVIVVDGGSQDETVAIARNQGGRVLQARRGRGSQMHAGACAARGDVLWFLHADTRPPVDAAARIQEALRRRNVVGGNFKLRFAGNGWAARFMTFVYPILGKFGLCYGDSAIFVRRAV